jgi:ElaB/YqjD/DUF883 family membrane-anchored ribosome-binding protein
MSSSSVKTTDVGTDLSAIRDDLAKLAETVATLLKQQGQAFAKDAAGTVAQTGETISAAVAGIKPGLKHAGASIAGDIERNPVTATMIAFGAGMALALLLRGRAHA